MQIAALCVAMGCGGLFGAISGGIVAVGYKEDREGFYKDQEVMDVEEEDREVVRIQGIIREQRDERGVRCEKCTVSGEKGDGKK